MSLWRRRGGILSGPIGDYTNANDPQAGQDSAVANGVVWSDLIGGPTGRVAAGVPVNPNLYDFDNMGNSGAVPGNAAFSNWTWWRGSTNAQSNLPNTIAVAPANAFGTGSYNVGVGSLGNRALGMYWTANGGAGQNAFCECDVVVPASGLFAMTFDHFIAWCRFTSASPRWCGMRVQITGSGVTFNNTIVVTTQAATTYYDVTTAIGKVSVAANWAGLTPGVQRLRFTAAPTNIFATPGGQNASDGKNVTSTIDNLLYIP